MQTRARHLDMVKSVQNDTPQHIHYPLNQNSDFCKKEESWCKEKKKNKSHIVHVNVSLLKHKHQKSSNHNLSVKLNLRKYLILSSDTIEQDYFILFSTWQLDTLWLKSHIGPDSFSPVCYLWNIC